MLKRSSPDSAAARAKPGGLTGMAVAIIYT